MSVEYRYWYVRLWFDNPLAYGHLDLPVPKALWAAIATIHAGFVYSMRGRG